MKECSSKIGVNNRVELEGHLSRSGSLPIRRRSGGSSSNSTSGGRRTSQAFNGLMIGVGGAAVVYAAVSALMRR